jgi:S1-C subfamily serine protease
MPFTLTSAQQRELREVIIDAYSPGDLAILARDHLGQPLHNLVASGTYRQQVFELVEACRQRGWLARLAFGVITERGENPRVIDFARDAGMHPAGAPGHIEKLVGPNTAFVDVHPWLHRCSLLASRVCQVRVRGKNEGTGFLVGPDTVLTNHHVVADALDAPAELSFVFDYVRGATGDVHPGVAFAAAEVRAASPLGPEAQWDDPVAVVLGDGELDFALIRLAEHVGTRGLADGGGGRPRGWIEFVPTPFDFAGTAGLAILQHPRGDPVKLALDFANRGVPVAGARRVRYTVPTEPGSSGSPVFSAESLTLVALHHGGVDHAFNQGIPISAIAAHPAVAAYLATVPPL